MSAENPPAFPQHGWSSDPEVVARMQSMAGMTLRDYFAAAAIGPLMSSNGIEYQLLKGRMSLADLPQFCAELAYETADAMLRERTKPQVP